MKAVFLGGSRRVSRLNKAIREKLDEIIARDLTVYVGDANGADRAMQQHLADVNYPNVIVFAISSNLRNNVGNWHVELVSPPRGAKGFDAYAAKDRAMAEKAAAGLMLWDGKSRGTLENVRNLVAHGKPVSVYLAPKQRFVNIRNADELMKAFPDAERPRSLGGVQTGLNSEQHDLLISRRSSKVREWLDSFNAERAAMANVKQERSGSHDGERREAVEFINQMVLPIVQEVTRDISDAGHKATVTSFLEGECPALVLSLTLSQGPGDHNVPESSLRLHLGTEGATASHAVWGVTGSHHNAVKSGLPVGPAWFERQIETFVRTVLRENSPGLRY